ncbi:MAG TPA: flagellar biosynthesis anti-sigma factor FlgM [Bryobacteraceae bacterium]|nr:flagellar biosynthesis anti-sigma factor FlgM [Bryobacteraceae bacterium]
MRVDDRHLTGNQAAQSGKTANPQEVERPNESRQAESRATGGSDRVELSSLTGGLARSLEASAQQKAGQVERLSRDYASGRYQVDAREVSRAMIAEMRAAGAASGEAGGSSGDS